VGKYLTAVVRDNWNQWGKRNEGIKEWKENMVVK
jgi:hypothetical protein